MTNFPFVVFIFDFFINGILTVFTCICILEILIFCFRINNYRIRYLTRALVLVKPLIDLALYQYHNWSYLHGIDLLLAEKGSRFLTIEYRFPFPKCRIFFHLDSGHTFSLGDIIRSLTGERWIYLLTGLFLLSSIFIFVYRIWTYCRSRADLSKIIADARPFSYQICNQKLQKRIKKYNILLKVSHTIPSSCICKDRQTLIIFPSSLIHSLNSSEIEAIIAHELSHYRWKDRHMRLFFYFLSGIFWFLLPYVRKIENEQEISADQSIIHYFNSPKPLLKALHKSLHFPTAIKSVCTFIPFSNLRKRILVLKHHSQISKKKLIRKCSYALLAFFLLGIFLGRIWIF